MRGVKAKKKEDEGKNKKNRDRTFLVDWETKSIK